MITAKFSSPVFASSNQFRTFALSPSGYTHTINADGGFASATFTVAGGNSDIPDANWFEQYALGSHVEVIAAGGAVAFEGFVNQVDIVWGGFTRSVGPLTELINRAFVVYSTVDSSTSPPTMGARAVTATANSTLSQSRYGIIERALSSGGLTAANAALIRDLVLGERAQPKSSQAIATGGGETLSVTVTVAGYVELLSLYVYNTTSIATQTTGDKIKAVLAGYPNAGTFSTDYGLFEANAKTVSAYENDYRTGRDVIRPVVGLGDASANRWLFGIAEGRRAYYKAVPTTVDYIYQPTAAGESQVRSATGTKPGIPPMFVRPGRWAYSAAFAPSGIPSGANLRTDRSATFIESVVYTAPNTLQLTGGIATTLTQKLNQLGLGGIGI